MLPFLNSLNKDLELTGNLPQTASGTRSAQPSTSEAESPGAHSAHGSHHSKTKQLPYFNVPSDRFVLSAGCTLFRTDPTSGQLQICAIHNTKSKSSNPWILPKGRKDQGESMSQTAVRETFEETGYPCDLFPCTLPTRSPAPGMSLSPYAVRQASEASEEPFFITVRELKEGSLKLVWWYIAWLRDNNAEKVAGVHMPSEDGYVSEFVDVPRALEIFEGTMFHEIVVKAVSLVTRQLEEASAGML